MHNPGEGDFDRWGTERVVNQQQKALFRWSFKGTGATGIVWQVRDLPFDSAFSPMGPLDFDRLTDWKYEEGVPASDGTLSFVLDTADYFDWPFEVRDEDGQLNPPNTIWVRVVAVDASQPRRRLRAVGGPSGPVKIVQDSKGKATDLSGIEPAPRGRLQVELVSFECKEESSDGPGSDEPYLVVIYGDHYWSTQVFEDVDSDDVLDDEITLYRMTADRGTHSSIDWDKAKITREIFTGKVYYDAADVAAFATRSFLIGLGECDNWHLGSGFFNFDSEWNEHRPEWITLENFGLRAAQRAHVAATSPPWDPAAVIEGALEDAWSDSLGASTLSFTAEELLIAMQNPGQPVLKTVEFTGDDSHYVATFRLLFPPAN